MGLDGWAGSWTIFFRKVQNRPADGGPRFVAEGIPSYYLDLRSQSVAGIITTTATQSA